MVYILKLPTHCAITLPPNWRVSIATVMTSFLLPIHLSGKDVYVETVEKDMYAAIDTLMDKLDRTILQHKEKSNRH